MALNIKNLEVEALAAEMATMTNRITRQQWMRGSSLVGDGTKRLSALAVYCPSQVAGVLLI